MKKDNRSQALLTQDFMCDTTQRRKKYSAIAIICTWEKTADPPVGHEAFPDSVLKQRPDVALHCLWDKTYRRQQEILLSSHRDQSTEWLKTSKSTLAYYTSNSYCQWLQWFQLDNRLHSWQHPQYQKRTSWNNNQWAIPPFILCVKQHLSSFTDS